jgi:hypothetical protein
MEEKWIDILGYESKYQISNLGMFNTAKEANEAYNKELLK